MARIHEEVQGGVSVRYVEAQEGTKIYLLPNVPMDAGEIPTEEGFDLEDAVARLHAPVQDRGRRIGEQYDGRHLDAMSILLYAQEKERFDEFAARLEAKPDGFSTVHPGLMMARTDVTAFMMRRYADRGGAPEAEAERAERQVRDYGVGVVVLPKT